MPLSLLRHERLDLVDRGRDLEFEELASEFNGCGSGLPPTPVVVSVNALTANLSA